MQKQELYVVVCDFIVIMRGGKCLCVPLKTCVIYAGSEAASSSVETLPGACNMAGIACVLGQTRYEAY